MATRHPTTTTDDEPPIDHLGRRADIERPQVDSATETRVCPACDEPNLRLHTGSMEGSHDLGIHYRCRDCGHRCRPGNVGVRRRKYDHVHVLTADDVLGQHWEMDPDEIRARIDERLRARRGEP